MITAFLITTLVVFSISLSLNLIVLGLNTGQDKSIISAMVGIVIYLLMITFNVFALVAS